MGSGYSPDPELTCDMASHDESSPVVFDLRVWIFAYNTPHRYGVSTVDGVPWIVMERAMMSLSGYLDSVGHGNLAYNVGCLLIARVVPLTVLTFVGPPPPPRSRYSRCFCTSWHLCWLAWNTCTP